MKKVKHLSDKSDDKKFIDGFWCENQAHTCEKINVASSLSVVKLYTNVFFIGWNINEKLYDSTFSRINVGRRTNTH